MSEHYYEYDFKLIFNIEEESDSVIIYTFRGIINFVNWGRKKQCMHLIQ
jgi:hypothetical protein